MGVLGMLADNGLIITLLVISACWLSLCCLLLAVFLSRSKHKAYYSRIRLELPEKKTSLSRLVVSLLSVLGIIVLIGLVIFLFIVLLRYISESGLAGLGDLPNANATIDNVTANASASLNQPANVAVSGLGKAVSGYWGYLLAGVIILVILILFLRRFESSAP